MMIKNNFTFTITTLFAILLTTIFTSCEHKDLCLLHPGGVHNPSDYDGSVKVRINVDWSQFDNELPSGMTVSAFPILSNVASTITSNDISHVSTYLSPGMYHLEVMGYSKHEYGTIDFLEDESGTIIGLQAKPTTSTWYTPDDDEVIALFPEEFAFDRQTNIPVDDPYADDDDDDDNSTARTLTYGDEILIATLYPVNIIYTVDVNVRVKGFKNLRSCAGVLQGLTSTLNFTTLHGGESTVTHLLETWSFAYDSKEDDSGILTASVSCLGLPYGCVHNPEDNTLKLNILLVDNKTTLSYTIPVGDTYKELGTRHFSFNVDDTILLPEVESSNQSTGSAGFDVTVDDWNEDNNNNIDIEI
jgi:hypothetical protein